MTVLTFFQSVFFVAPGLAAQPLSLAPLNWAVLALDVGGAAAAAAAKKLELYMIPQNRD